MSMAVPSTSTSGAGKCAFPVDLWRIRPYLGVAMLRQLLTLLALITGLAATAAPAETRLAAHQGVQVQAETEKSAVALAQRIAPVASRVSEAAGQAAPLTAITLERRAPGTPAVRIGLDRAHE